MLLHLTYFEKHTTLFLKQDAVSDLVLNVNADRHARHPQF